MPRVRKTSTGQNAQPIQAVSGQTYGDGVKQESMQRAMPTPEASPVAVAAGKNATAEQDVPPQQANQPRERMSLEQVAGLLRGQGGILRRPDDRPEVPFTQSVSDPSTAFRLGLMRRSNQLGEMMRDLSRRTGDPTFANLASKAGY